MFIFEEGLRNPGTKGGRCTIEEAVLPAPRRAVEQAEPGDHAVRHLEHESLGGMLGLAVYHERGTQGRPRGTRISVPSKTRSVDV